MLKFIGEPKRVEIRRLRIEGSVQVDMRSENVREIAESLKEGALLHPSLVDRATNKIVCGRDRILAQMLNGMKSALVQYVTGSPVDLARAHIDENLCRRHDDKGALRKKLKDDLAEALAQEAINCRDLQKIAPQDEKPKRGRPNTGKTAAVAAIAKKEGVSPRTVHDSIKRVGKKEAEPVVGEDGPPEEQEPAVPAPKVSCLGRTLGLEVPELVEDAARNEQKRVDRMAKALQEFGAALTDHRKEQAGLNAADDKTFEEWEGQRSVMAAAIRRSRPACLCPHCKPHMHEGKLVADLLPTCSGCRGVGYISEEKLEGIEKALLAEGDDAGVWVPERGKRPQWRTLSSLQGEDF